MSKPYKSKLITSYVTRDDIDLDNKLNNLCESGEISDETFEKCREPKTFIKLEEKIWNMMKNSAEPYHSREFYEGLAKEYDAKDENDMYAACLYNCDSLYLDAINRIIK